MKIIQKHIGFIGCGNMGSAILLALLREKVIFRKNVFVCDSDARQRGKIRRKYGVTVIDSTDHLFSVCDIIVLAVKPQSLSDISIRLTRKQMQKKVIISILAGTTIKTLKKKCKTDNIIRVMPNLGAMLGVGISVLTQTKVTPMQSVQIAKRIFAACGEVVELPEKLFNVITAVSGSGPAYYFYFTELLVAEAKRQGVPEKQATKLAVKTATAAALMMEQRVYTPSELRSMVTSKGGTTEAALKAMKINKIEGTFSKGVRAAIKRGEMLSQT